MLFKIFEHNGDSVRVFLMGGLGNQMFQFAAGFAASKRQKKRLILDTSFFDLPSHSRASREYELREFAIPADIDEVRNGELYFRFCRKVSSLLPDKMLNYFGVLYQKDPFESNNHDVNYRVLIGYFQNKNAFRGYEADVKRVFSDMRNLSDGALAIKARIRSCSSSICLHVRRGDYVTNSSGQSQHGTQSASYYLDAIQSVKSKVQNNSVDVFVFSDDLDWCREHFRCFERVEFVETSSMTSPEVMFVMSSCRHFIISNSTFSWWAAWLGKTDESVVIMPDKWTMDLDTKLSGLLL